MGNIARVGVFCLMGLAIAVARLVEVEFQPEALVVTTDAPRPLAEEPEEFVSSAQGSSATAAVAGEVLAEAGNGGEGGRTYEVRPGDNLGTISQKVYGTARHWKAILEANRDVIPDPRRMRAGVRLKIPEVKRDRSSGASR